jgi:hypothetical protein
LKVRASNRERLAPAARAPAPLRYERGSVYEFDFTLRCSREVFEKLKPVGYWEELPELMKRLRNAILASLPSGYGIANFCARAGAAPRKPAETPASGANGKAAPARDDANLVMREVPGGLDYDRFTEPASLAKVGRKIVRALVEPFAADLKSIGRPLPSPSLPDAEYFPALSQILRTRAGLPTALLAKIDEMLEMAKHFAAEYRKETQKEFAKDHLLIRLGRRETGRALLNTVAAGDGMIQDYPERLTPEQGEAVGGVLSFLRDYADIHQDVEPDSLMKYENEMTDMLASLARLGPGVFVGSYRSKKHLENCESFTVRVNVVLVTALADKRIERDADGASFIQGAVPRNRHEEAQKAAEQPKAPPEGNKGTEELQRMAASVEALGAELVDFRKSMAEVVQQKSEIEAGIRKTEAHSVFAVLTQLRTEPGIRKAPLHTVFEFVVLQGLSGKDAAKRCRCVPSLITARVKTIVKRFGMPIERLQNYASDIRDLETSVKGQRQRKKNGGAPLDEASHDDGENANQVAPLEEYQFEQEPHDG